MQIVNLSEKDFQDACLQLASKIDWRQPVVAIVGVRTGGALVSRNVAQYASSLNREVVYFEISASRTTTTLKNSSIVKNLIIKLPIFLTNQLRIIESLLTRLPGVLRTTAPRSISIDEGLINYLSSTPGGSVYIFDDAVDSGSTLTQIITILKRIQPDTTYRSAVITVTQGSPLIEPDYYLYKDVLIRFPWALDA